MKKYLASILSLILALAMVFTLVACGGDDSSSDDDDDDSSSSKASSSQSSSDESDSSNSEDPSSEEETSSKEEPSQDKKPVASTDSIDGDWEGVVTGNMGGMEVDGIGLTATFDDGDAVLQIDVDDMIDMAIEYALEEAGEGYTLDDLLEESEMTEDELYAYFEDYFSGMCTIEITYEFDGSTLTLGDKDVDFEFDGEKLTIYGDDGQIYELERA